MSKKPVTSKQSPVISDQNPEVDIQPGDEGDVGHIAGMDEHLSPSADQADGYELNPDEAIANMTYEHRGMNKVLKHVLSGLPGRETEMNINREVSRQRMNRDGEISSVGDISSAKIAAWDALILRVEGYSKSEKLSIEEMRKLVPAKHKIRAIDSLMEFEVAKPEDELDDDGLFPLEENPDDFVVSLNVLPEMEVPFVVTHEFKIFQPFALAKIMQGITYKSSGRSGIDILNRKGLLKIDEFYDKHIKTVSGYLSEGEPVMEVAKWMKKIPVGHKALALETVCKNLEGVEKK